MDLSIRMEGYNCQCCKTELYKNTIGPHYIKKHPEFIVEHFMPYSTIHNPTAPYKGRHGFYLCLCCKKYHTSTASAKKHLEKCSAADQIEAIYALINKRPTTTTVVVKAEAPKSDAGLIKMIHGEISKTTALQNEINRMKKQLAVERQQAKAYKLWAEKDRYIAVSVEKERYQTLCDRLRQDNGDGWQKHIAFANTIEADEDEVHTLAALRMSYDCYNKDEIVPPAVLEVTPAVLEVTPAVLEVTPAALEVTPVAPISKPPSHCEGCSHEADAKELHQCSECRHSFHIQSDLWGCWTHECMGCGKGICDNCRKASGSTKMSPKCSKCSSGPSSQVPRAVHQANTPKSAATILRSEE